MTMLLSSSLVSNSADRATFEDFYDGKAPWDIGKPQGTFAAAADQVTGPVLDAGCGTGEHALFFAARGHRVIGIDFVEERNPASPGQGSQAGPGGGVPCQGRDIAGGLG